MKVRKFLFAGALIAASLFSVNSVMAEDVVTPTASVTVNLKFKPIQSIVVNADSVNLTYATVSDYSGGKTTGVLEDHITIYSTGGFQVKVKAGGDYFIRNGVAIGIPVGDVKISATEGTDAPASTCATEESLTASGVDLVSASVGGTAINYNVVYNNTAAGGSNNYINKYISADGAESVYSTTVTYTIAAN